MKLHYFFIIFFVLIISFVSFSDFGPANYMINDTVLITGNGYGNISLLAPQNTSYQTVDILLAPKKYTLSGGYVNVNFNVSNTSSISNRQINLVYNVHVDYTKIRPDSNNTPLNKLMNVTNGVYNTFTYNINSDDYNRTIDDIFQKKEGTCVAYARAGKYILNESGINTHFVYGYSYEASLYHVWLVYNGANGTGNDVEFDPTYDEVGFLNNDHITFGYSDSIKMVDIKLNYYGKVNVSHNTSVKLINSSTYNQNISCDFIYHNNSIIFKAIDRDPTQFMFKNIGTFSKKSIIGSVFGSDTTILPTNFKMNEVTAYSLNLSAKYNDVVCNKELIIGSKDAVNTVSFTNNVSSSLDDLIGGILANHNDVLMIVSTFLVLIGLLLYLIGRM